MKRSSFALLLAAACRPESEPNEAVEFEAAVDPPAGVHAPGEQFLVHVEASSEFRAEEFVAHVDVIDNAVATVTKVVSVEHEGGTQLFLGPTMEGDGNYYAEDGSEKERATFTLQCTETGGQTTMRVTADWYNETGVPLSTSSTDEEVQDAVNEIRNSANSVAHEETTFDVDCTGMITADEGTESEGPGDSGTDDTGDSDGDSDTTTDDDTGTDTGVSTEPVTMHMYVAADFDATAYALVYGVDDTISPMPGGEITVPGPPSTVAATPDGRGVYFGSDVITAYARDAASGALTPVGDPIMRATTLGVLRTSADGSRLFAADLNINATDLTQYAVADDSRLVEGASFAVGPFPSWPATGGPGDFLYAPYSNDGGGLVVFDLGAVSDPPTQVAAEGPFELAADAIVAPGGQCLYVASGGDGVFAFDLGADGTPAQVGGGTASGSARVWVTPDGGHALIAFPGASGRVETYALQPDCGLGEIVDSLDSPMGLFRHSNMVEYGDDALVFEFSSGMSGHAVFVAPDGTIDRGADLEVPDFARAMMLLPEG